MTATMTINNELNGIEISFKSIPGADIRETMKNAGYRWHKIKKLWYAKQTAERLSLAQKICGGNIQDAPASAPAEIKNKYGLKVGDILYDSWGYSMTIVEFYQVTKILSPCKVEIVELGHKAADEDGAVGYYGECLPDTDRVIGEPITKTCQKDKYSRDENAFYIKINRSVSLRPWGGHAVYFNSLD